MDGLTELETPRLYLRTWRETDLPEFAALNADAQVMRYFPARLDREQSDILAGHICRHFARHGFGPWVVERRWQSGLIGVVGLLRVGFEASFAPAIEISWRMARAHWRRGYALEAAGAALDYAFERLQQEEIVAFTVPDNMPSRRLMERLGMQLDQDGEFDHPNLPDGHPLQRHLLYRLPHERWQALRCLDRPADRPPAVERYSP